MSLTASRVSFKRPRLQDSLFIGQTTLITQDEQGNYGACGSDGYGSLKVKGGEQTLFGIQKDAFLNTLIQSYAPYGILNNQLFTLYSATGGTITANSVGNGIDLNITTSVGSYAVIRSKKVMKFRPGYSNQVRFDCTFDTPVALSLQFGGVGNAGSDFYFCYNGTDFAIRSGSGGILHVVTLTINTAANSSETATVTLNGTAHEVALTDASSDKNFTACEIANFSFTGWKAEAVDNVIHFHYRGVGAKSGTYSFSSTGAAAGTGATVTTGADITKTYVNQSDWNGTSPMIQNLDPLTRNAYSIEYSCGNTIFKVLNPDTGKYELVHTLTTTNYSGAAFMNQPNLFIQRGISSLGSTTAMTMQVSGSYGGTYGEVNINASTEPLYGTSVEKSISAATETVLMVVKNRNIFNGFINQSEIYFERMSISVAGTSPVKFKIIKNPTTISAGTTTDFTHYMFIDEDNSLSLCDTNSDTYTGGIILDQFYVGKEGNIYSDFHGNEMIFNQSDVFIVTAESSATSTVDLSITLLEDI